MVFCGIIPYTKKLAANAPDAARRKTMLNPDIDTLFKGGMNAGLTSSRNSFSPGWKNSRKKSLSRSLRRPAVLGLLVSAIVLSVLHAGQETRVLETLSGVAVEASARSFQPGEAVMFTVREAPEETTVTVTFLDQTLVLHRPGTGKSMGFLGIDLAAAPGVHSWTIKTEDRDGHWEEARSGLTVAPKNFPVRRLRVAQEFVTPPAAVQDRIRREAELLALVYSMPSPEWLGDGPFILPHGGRPADNFGERRFFNDEPRSPHTGLDIAAPMGDPVRASNSGRVVLASDLYFAGKTVIIDHGRGVFSLYCHFSKILVKRTQFVEKGETIGLIGSTGRSTGPHLHWGVRVFDSRVDPMSLTALSLD